MEYVLQSTHERHQKYLGAFRVSPFLAYHKLLVSFINDQQVSHHNSDDVDFFRDLLLNSPYSQCQHSLYSDLLKITNSDNVNYHAKTLSMYCLYLKEINSFVIKDMFYDIIDTKKHDVILMMVKHLESSYREEFLDIICNRYPELLKEIPRLQLCVLFS